MKKAILLFITSSLIACETANADVGVPSLRFQPKSFDSANSFERFVDLLNNSDNLIVLILYIALTTFILVLVLLLIIRNESKKNIPPKK
jgi:hypothetical protein